MLNGCHNIAEVTGSNPVSPTIASILAENLSEGSEKGTCFTQNGPENARNVVQSHSHQQESCTLFSGYLSHSTRQPLPLC